MITEFKVLMDPANVYEDIDPQRLFEAAGLIPGWMGECHIEGVAPADLAEAMQAKYGFQCQPIEGGTFTDSPVMTYDYPGDPDLSLQPYMVLLYPASQGQPASIIGCYEHSFFAFKHGQGDPVVYRMD